MKQLYILLFGFLLFPLLCYSSNLPTQLDELKKHVGKVEGEKSSFEQEISYDPAAPYRIELVFTETDKKGRVTENRAVFNLALLNKNLVRRENSRDLMWVSAKSGKMPVIKMYENDVLSNYTGELKIYSRDVDNARAIEEILKAAIPLAEEAWKSSIALPAGLPALRQWVADHIKEVDAGDKVFQQAIVPDNEHPARVWLNREEHTDKGLKKAERFGWNFGDLHEPSVSMRIRGKQMMVEASTRQKQKFVRTEEDGELKGFSNNITLYADDIDQAHLLVQVLREMIPLAREASEKALLQPASLEEGVRLLCEQITEFTVNQDKYEQSLVIGPTATYTHRQSNEKKSSEEKFVFDPGDLNEQSVSIEAGKQAYEVSVSTREGQSLIESWKNGEQQNYSKQLSFYVAELSAAKQLAHLLSYVIPASRREFKPQNFAWLQTTMAGFDEQQLGIRQQLEPQEGDNCKLAVSTFSESSRKVDEHLIEFNLYDIDPNQLSLVVKGKTVSVLLPTNYREEIIKDYANGDKIKYIREFAFVVPSIETGKEMIATLGQMVRDCSQK